jgi:Putative DNA-binding domain
MPDFKDRTSFQKLVDAQVEETLTLEYKASPALTRDSKNVLEVCKDVSAMANSAGGQIIYGILEDRKTHKPLGVDDGVTDEKITREWIHQILGSNIHPRLDGLTVQRIPLSETGFGFVISIEPTQTGPHQAPDNKYYKRFELEAKPMEDYEVRDIMRRATTPDLSVELSFAAGEMRWEAEFKGDNQDSETFFIWCTVVNRSATPAYYAIVELWIDRDLKVPFSNPPFKNVRIEQNTTGQSFRVYQRTLLSPPGVPVFKEAVHETHSAQLPMQLQLKFWQSSMSYLETNIQAPGFSKREEWFINCNGGRMQLRRAPK